MLSLFSIRSAALTASLTLALAAFTGCGKKKEEKGSGAPGAAGAATAAVVDSGGEFDPIANPAAAAGGTYVTWGGPSPKSINMWLDYTSFAKSVMDLLYESLVTLHSTKDEPVGVLAESWEISEDGKTFTFHIDPRARWSDGKPVTVRDFQFFYDVIMNPKNMTPIFRVGLSRFDRPEAVDSLTLRIQAREAHWSNFWEAAGLVAFPEHAWKGKDFNTRNFDFEVVSGPYRLGEVKRERYISLERRDDWWGRTRRYNQYKYNFGQIKYRFMEDRNKALEAFKKGDFDAYPIYTAALWAEQTGVAQIPGIATGAVARHAIYNQEPKGFQGFAINLRRPLFQDVRVRLALSHLLNRELINDKLMYNQYFLLNSYYPDLYPGNKNPNAPFLEYNPGKARKLFAEAGWKPGPDGVLTKGGKRFSLTFLTASVMPHYNVYLEDLKKAGVDARLDQMSASTVSKRMDNHDFDLYWAAWGASRLRDPEASWKSSTADEIASNNYPGVKDKEIDALIEAQKTEMDLGKRNEILAKLDARLTAIVPYILLWQSDNTRLLYWNRFGTPKYLLDKYNREDAIIPYWFVDKDKDAAVRGKKSQPVDTGAVRYRD
ncbi:MAG: extracellular solute-binding protein family 5 [Fibrobacteria bacterium]|jgi:microcin C transport system substrate-binding protein|nr:extracellular solute-binding protein family 5 [Fibrobacteria bacterium]